MAKYKGSRSEYEFSLDQTKKVFHAQASGSFSVEDGNSFINDYKNLTKSLPANTYSLIINAPELKPSSPEVAEMLGSLLKMYIDVPFKSRYLVTKGNTITMMQFKRLGGSIPGWTESVEYVNEFEEVLKKV